MYEHCFFAKFRVIEYFFFCLCSHRRCIRTVFVLFVTHCLFVLLFVQSLFFKHRWHCYAVPACSQHQRCFSGSSSSSWTRSCSSSGSRGRCRRSGPEVAGFVVAAAVGGGVEQRGEGGTGEVRGSFLRLNCACCSNLLGCQTTTEC